MANVISSSSPSPPTFAVFVDTNLDTHLAMVVSPEDTVGDIKRKIQSEHALCFPIIGEITVQAMKVRRKASFYHLSDSMFVRSAFTGIKGTWFLHIDVVKPQPGTAKDIMSESGGQSEKHHVIQEDPTSSMPMGSSADRDKGFVMNQSSAEKDLILSESQTLPNTLPQKLSVQADSSLPNFGSCQTLCLQGSSNDLLVLGDTNVDSSKLLNLEGNALPDNFGKSPSELEKRSDPDVPEMQEPVSENIAAVGSNLLHKTGLVADEGEKDVREEDSRILGVESNDGGASTVAVKKEKSRKRSALKNEELLESKSHHSVEKKKRKKEKDGSFKKPIEDHVKGSNYESFVSSKVTSELEKFPPETSSQDKHEINPDVPEMQEPISEDIAAVESNLLHKTGLVANEGENNRREEDCRNLGVGSNDRGASTVAVKKEKSRKRSSALKNGELLESKSHHYVEKKKHKKEKDGSFREPAEDHVKQNNFESTVNSNETSELEKFPPETSSQDKHETNPASTEGLPSKPSYVDSSLPQNPTDDKQKKKKKKKRSSKLQDEVDTAIPFDTHDPKIGLFNDSSKKNEIAHLSIEKVTEENTEGYLGKNHDDSEKETAQNLIHGGSAEFMEGKDPVELSKSHSGRINFVEYFVPKEQQHELVVETKKKKENKEKTKRTRKSELASQDPTPALGNPSGSDKQHMLTKNPQDSDSGNHGLVDPLVQLTSKELKTRKTHNKKTVKRTRKSNVHPQDTLSDVWSPLKSHDDDLPEKELQGDESDSHNQVSMLVDEKEKDINAKKSVNSDSKHQSLPGNEGNAIIPSADEVPQYKNFDASVRSSHGSAPVAQNHSIASADDSTKKAMSDLLAPSDSTEEETPYQRKRYRVVRKIPSKRYEKVLSKSDQEKMTTSATIFNDATSGSSEDELEINNRQSTIKTASDNSATSADSDGDLEETLTTTSLLKPQVANSPGVESTAHGKNDKETNGGDSILMKSTNNRRKSMPLSMILKSSNSYRKAKLTASQSELEDTESQPVDVVLETQPDFASP